MQTCTSISELRGNNVRKLLMPRLLDDRALSDGVIEVTVCNKFNFFTIGKKIQAVIPQVRFPALFPAE